MTFVEPVSPAYLPPLAFATVPEYGAHLGDAGFWAPYLAEVLARHGLLAAVPHGPSAVGTFPTFIVGRYVVKFFGELFSGAASHEVELSLHRLLRAHPAIPASALIAHGQLFGNAGDAGDGWPWPYLVTTRLGGTAWRDAALPPAEREHLARQLGSSIRQVHELPLPAGSAWERDRLADLRAGCVQRHHQWATLPANLIDQIDLFLVAPSSVRRLIHADLHQDHLFVDGARLVGIIDWGDALVTDPYYELPAVHLHTFGGSKPLLTAFLEGYGWEVGADFAERAMTMTLLHEFDVLGGLGKTLAAKAATTLDELARLLWELPGD